MLYNLHFPRLDISGANKGTKIPLQQRSNLYSLAISKFQDLNAFPRRISAQFNGNDSRGYHLLINDVTEIYSDKTIIGDVIDSNIKSACDSKRKNNFLSFGQQFLITEYHTHAFNV